MARSCGLDVAQVDLALRVRRRGVDRLAALDGADVDGDAARQVGQRVHGDDLVRQLADGADALLEVAARVRGLAEHLELEEHAALAARDDGAARPARLGVEHAARLPRDALDDRAATTARRSPRRW